MHILLIHQAFAALDEAGGTRHFEIARYLVKEGHRVSIIASPVSYISGRARGERIAWQDVVEVQPGLTIHRTYTYPALHRSFVHRVFSFLSFMASSMWAGLGIHKVDLVWGTSPPIFQGATAWLLARLKGVPFVFEVRDLWPAFAIGVGVLRNKTLIALSLWLEKFLYTHADQLVVNSPGFVEHIKARGAGSVEIIPNGADPEMFDPAADGKAFRQEHNLEGCFIAIYAGAHGMSNDLGVVLEAARLLQDQPKIKVILVGDGKEKQRLQTEADAMGLENVLFLPPFAKEAMAEVLAAADVCIAILKPIAWYKTTYPNKVFDYMAAGRPVVLAIDGVIRQVVDDAGAGVFTPPGDPQAMALAIEKLAGNPSALKKMGAAGRAYVEKHFNRAVLAQQLLSLFVEVVRKHDRKNTCG